MRQIDIKTLKEDFIADISEEWMLVTAGTKDSFNTMTASWGGIGFLWGKPVAFVFIRPERHTFGFMEAGTTFTLSFLGNENRDIYKVCGSTSGRDTDKIAATGLRPTETGKGNILFEQCRLGLECRTLYSDMLTAEAFKDKELIDRWYGSHGGLHKMYVAEITDAWIKE